MGKRSKTREIPNDEVKTGERKRNKKAKPTNNDKIERSDCELVELCPSSKMNHANLKETSITTTKWEITTIESGVSNKDPSNKLSTPNIQTVQTKKKNKIQKVKHNLTQDIELAVEDNDKNSEPVEEPTPRIKKKSRQNESLATQNTKTQFIEEVHIDESNHPLVDLKTKNTPSSPEDDVKDEDIDKFCDEITEEDNVQYENWVKLIEAKLNSNKKKPK